MTEIQQHEAPTESAFLKTLVLLGARRRLIAGGILAAALFAALVALIIPVTYTATTVILTPQTMPSSAAALLGELSSLGSLASLAGDNQFKSPSDTFLGVLSSRSVADALIQRFDLQHVYRKHTLVDTRKALAKQTHIENARRHSALSRPQELLCARETPAPEAVRLEQALDCRTHACIIVHDRN